ncbi:MAG: hypothetical protein AAB557_00805 [Patescibacteria group bacterium]
METGIFWIVWGLISFWALKTFYYSFSKDKLNQLRLSALGVNLSVLVLAFLPWIPASLVSGQPALGWKSGMILAWEGNILAVVCMFLIIVSVSFFFTKNSLLYKIASCATIANTFVHFFLMRQLRPGTFTLTRFDIAPIIAVLLLLVGDVVVLLLWQQLQLKQRTFKRTKKK